MPITVGVLRDVEDRYCDFLSFVVLELAFRYVRPAAAQPQCSQACVADPERVAGRTKPQWYCHDLVGGNRARRPGGVDAG